MSRDQRQIHRILAEVASHYDLLGVEPDATDEAIKRAYYEKARAFHPDAHASSSVTLRREAERAMRDLNEAWNTLRSARARRAYDEDLARERAAFETAQDRRRDRRRRMHGEQAHTPLALGSGFRYWLGSTGMLSDDDGGARVALAVDGAGDLAPLQRLAPNGLWALHAQRAPIGDEQLHHLAGLRGLTFLDLSGTRVTDAGLLHLQGLFNLEVLMLWDTAITDEGLFLLRHLTSLRHLGLGNTAVTDAGLAHLFALHRLRVLQLWGTEVHGPGLSSLQGLKNLEIVTVPWKVRGRARRRLKRSLPVALIS